MIRFTTLIEALNAAPGEKPFITVWIDEDEQESVTFAEFRRRARGQAASLRQHGVGSGDRVVLIMPQNVAAMTTFAACMMLGAVPAFVAYPNFKVEPSKYRAGLAGVTKNLKASLVVIDQDFPDEMLGCVAMGEAARLLRIGAGVDPAGAELRDAPPPRPEGLAFIQHSAGTTGLQKGVALTHAAVLRQLDHLILRLKVDPATDCIYSWLPLYHDMGLIACFMLPMVCHAPVVMQSPLDWVMQPESMLQIFGDYRCTLAWLPNFAFQFVPRRTPKSRWGDYDLSSARALINCSEPVRASSMDEFAAAFAPIGLRKEALHSCYAMAETVFAVTQSDIDSPAGPLRIWADPTALRGEHRIRRVAEDTPGALCFTSSGRLLPNTEARIASEAGSILADGRIGEIQVKSDCMFEGYYNRPDLTAKAMSGEWYCTGDLGFLLDEELFVVGRKKDLLIVGGENLYPHDIEEIVAAHPCVHDGRVIAMGIYNPELGTEDVVVVAEVEREEMLEQTPQFEKEIRASILHEMGVAVRTILLKPPKWIIKSTAGKAARSSTREKLLREHPEFHTDL